MKAPSHELREEWVEVLQCLAQYNIEKNKKRGSIVKAKTMGESWRVTNLASEEINQIHASAESIDSL